MQEVPDGFQNMALEDFGPPVSKITVNQQRNKIIACELSFGLCQALSLSLMRTVIQTTSFVDI